MSSTKPKKISESRAEKAFRDAFDRLKRDQPIHVPKGTPFSQNNVAKEAGCDPSALRKLRYPALIDEIQLWVSNQKAKLGDTRKVPVAEENRGQALKERIARLQAQRDSAISMLVEADAKILELVKENEELRSTLSTNVIELNRRPNGSAPSWNVPRDEPDV